MPELKMKMDKLNSSCFWIWKGSIKRAEIEATIDGNIFAFRELLDHPTVNKLPIELKTH